MNAVVQLEPRAPAPPQALQVSNFNQAVELAKMMSGASLVPAHLQGKPADCLLVIEQASRWNMSPFAVAQATSVISGKLMFEGKLVAAAINSSGALIGRLSFAVNGGKCVASGLLRGEKEPRTVEVTLDKVRTQNKMWTSQPEQQLCYSAARIWARRHLPEVMLGVYSPEEDFSESQAAPIHGFHDAPKVDPAVRDAVKTKLEDAAKQGSAALKAAWEGLTTDERKALKSDLAALKQTAEGSDYAGPAPQEEPTNG